MLYANDIHNQKIDPEPHVIAYCQYCKEQVIPKCGPINIWHFAHEPNNSCDPWYTGEGAWHRNWKSKFPKENIEVFLSKGGESHIADYYNPLTHSVVEFQNTSLSLDERVKREFFYPNLTWVIHYNGSGLYRDPTREIPEISIFKVFRWKNPVKWITTALNTNCKYYLDTDRDDGMIFRILQSTHEKFWEMSDFGSTFKHHVFICGFFVTVDDLIKTIRG